MELCNEINTDKQMKYCLMSSWMLTPRNKSFLRIWWLTLHIFPELRCNSSSTQNYDGFWVEVQFFSRQKFIFRPAVNNNQLCLDRWEPRVAINHPRVPPPLVSHHWVSLQRRTVKHLRWMRWKRKEELDLRWTSRTSVSSGHSYQPDISDRGVQVETIIGWHWGHFFVLKLL